MRAGEINSDRPIIRQTRFTFRNERVYTFDVNQNVTILKLKKMIIIAANIQKKGLRLFSRKREYTHEDESMLESLFPDQQLVEFTFDTYDIESDDTISLRFKEHCIEHPEKFPYFYCYDCKESICPLCVKSPRHSDHNIKEKYDYLQDSHLLVEGLFTNLNSILESAKDINQETIDEFIKTISVNFNLLIQKIKMIELSLIDLVKEFNVHKSDNFIKIRGNVENLKDYCAKGLDGLKESLVMKNLIVDEKVFLIIDETLKNLNKEEKRVASDVQLFTRFHALYQKIKDHVDQTYKKIDSNLELILRDNRTAIIKQEAIDLRIEVVSGEQLIRLIASGKKSQSNTLNRVIEAVRPYTNLSIEGLKYTAKINQGTDKIMVYDSNSITSRVINFSRFSCLSNFLYNCAWCNYNNKLYFSGGLDNNIASKTFCVYEIERDSLKRLPNMTYGHYSHSMLLHNNALYVLGGKTCQCEKFDFNQNEWKDIQNLKFVQQYPVLYPYGNFIYSFFGLDVKENYIDTIQRLNIKKDNSEWELVAYNRNGFSLEMYGCGIVNSNANRGVIYFIGGKDATEVRKTTIEFNFNNHSCNKSSLTIDPEAYFKESVIPQFVDFKYKAFSLQDNNLIEFQVNTV